MRQDSTKATTSVNSSCLEASGLRHISRLSTETTPIQLKSRTKGHSSKTHISDQLERYWLATQSTSCRRVAATICPRPGLQVVTRHTSCTHMDRSPLLMSVLDCQYNQPKQPGDLDLWPFEVESGVRVTSDVGYLCASFSLPRSLCSRLKPNVCDRQTDVRQHHRLMLPGWGITTSRHWRTECGE